MGQNDEISAVRVFPTGVWLDFGTRAHFGTSGDRLVMKLADASQTLAHSLW